MDLASLLLALALLLVVIGFVLQPLLRSAAAGEATPARWSGGTDQSDIETEALLARREGVLAALLDLDFDSATGKIAAADYDAQRSQLVAAGVEILRQLDTLSVLTVPEMPALEARVEQAVVRLREAAPQNDAVDVLPTTHCPQCDAALRLNDKFCASCGALVAAAEDLA